jgi:hypothetical protein
VKALGILRELGQFDGRFYASDGDEDYSKSFVFDQLPLP